MFKNSSDPHIFILKIKQIWTIHSQQKDMQGPTASIFRSVAFGK